MLRLKHLLPSCFLLFAICTQGQTVWNKYYLQDRPTISFLDVVEEDGYYKFSGLTGVYPNYYPRGMIGTIDSLGYITHYKIIGDSTIAYYYITSASFIRNSEGGYAFAGESIDSIPYILFGIANKNLTSASVFRYSTPNTFDRVGFALVQSDGYYYVAGINLPGLGYDGDILLVKIDSNGNRVWEKYFDYYLRDEAVSIIKLSNGNLMLGAGRNNLNTIIERAHTWLLEVDTNGGIVRQWIDPNDSTNAARGLKQTYGGGFIYAAQKKYSQSVNTVTYTNTIVKMNQNFLKEWVYNRAGNDVYPGITDVEQLSDGNFIACGRYYDSSVDPAVYGWVVKLDGTGTVIWEKLYRAINASHTLNFLYDIDELADGSLIAVGECQYPNNSPIQAGWFLKLDANGCELQSCLIGIDEQIPADVEVEIFPNPASTSFTVSIPETLIGSTLSITDITGKQIAAVQLQTVNSKLETDPWANGIYFIKAGNTLQKLMVQR